MRTAIVLLSLFGAACSKSPPVEKPVHVAISAEPSVPPVADAEAPLADASVDATSPAARKKERSFPTHAADAKWVRSLARSKTFATYDLGAKNGEDVPIDFHWRVHSRKRIAGAPPGEEYPSLYAATVDLVVTRGNMKKTIDLGEHSGSPEGSTLPFCRRSGYRQPTGESWSFPELVNLVTSFGVDTLQGGSEWLVILARDVMHVVGRSTHDGSCPIMTVQGPLRVCADMKWEHSFDITVSGEPRMTESISMLDDKNAATPLDCKASYSGSRLIDP